MFSVPLTTCLAVASSCLLWISGISWIVVALFGLSATVGWVIAGTLGVLAAATIGIMLHEVRHAIDLPDDLDTEFTDSFSSETLAEEQAITPRLRTGRLSRVHARC